MKKSSVSLDINKLLNKREFLKLNIDDVTSEYINGKSKKIYEEGFQNALELFHKAAENVPAYKDFLKKNNINHRDIKTYKDFKKIPIIDKKNYLRAYPLKDLAWNGSLNNLSILSSSSGSTGEPFLWPRGENQDLEGAINFEIIFKNVFHADKLSTLYIDGFSMGTWISGPFVLSCAQNLSKKGYPIMTITPGIDTDVTLNLLKNLSPNFDQVVISGYPPLIKDLLDMGENYGINWKNYNIKFLFAAEGFSEKWRDYIHKKVGQKNNLTTSINLYGSADAAILANETPLTTAIRREISDSPRKLLKIFGDSRIPTLAQYDPRLKFFENVDSKLIFTTNSGIPLIRYSIGDEGGLYTYHSISKALKNLGINIRSIIGSEYKWRLPFVYVFGRSDLTVSFYGLLVYPEHIKYGLERAKLNNYITGKFVLSTENTDTQDPYLLIRVELVAGEEPNEKLEELIQKSIVKGLRSLNSEYQKLNQVLNGKAIPKIELIKNNDPLYFKKGMKQKWIKKN